MPQLENLRYSQNLPAAACVGLAGDVAETLPLVSLANSKSV